MYEYESYFDGSLSQLIGIQLGAAFMILFTAGICLPWAVCMRYRWETKHMIIDGHRLRFDGSAIGLFGNWIKWWLLTIVTVGIYSFFISIKLRQWKTKNTHFA